MKKVLSGIVALAMVLAFAPVGALAAGRTWEAAGSEALTEALQSASPGDTVLLTEDITGLTSAVTIDKGVTLDLGTHTLSGSGVKGGFILITASGGAHVTIRNGTLELTGVSNLTGYLISTAKGGDLFLTLESLTASTTANSPVINSDPGDHIHIRSGSLQSKRNMPLSTSGAYLLEEGVRIISTSSVSSGGTGMRPWSVHGTVSHENVALAQGCYADVVIGPDKGRTLTVTRGTLPDFCLEGPHGWYTSLREAVAAELTGPEPVTMFVTATGPEEDVEIPANTSLTLTFSQDLYRDGTSGDLFLYSGITVRGSLTYTSPGAPRDPRVGILGHLSVAEGGKLTFSQSCLGVFRDDVSEYCPWGLVSVYQPEEGWYRVMQAAVWDGDTKTPYSSLAAALRAGEKNVKLTADWSEDLRVTAGDGPVTIDLNGHRLSGNGSGRSATVTVEAGARVKIVGTKPGSALRPGGQDGVYAVENQGDLTLTNVTVTGADASAMSASLNALVRSRGRLTVTGGSIENSSDLSPGDGWDGGVGLLIYGGGTGSVSDAHITAGYNGVYVESGHLDITGDGTVIEWQGGSHLPPGADGRRVAAVDAASEELIAITGGRYNSNVSRFVPSTHAAVGTGAEGDSCVVVPVSDGIKAASGRIILLRDAHVDGENAYEIVLESGEPGKAIMGFRSAALRFKIDGEHHHLTYEIVRNGSVLIAKSDDGYTFTAPEGRALTGSRVVLGVVVFSGIGEGTFSLDGAGPNTLLTDNAASLVPAGEIRDEGENIRAYGGDAPVLITGMTVPAGGSRTDGNGVSFRAGTDLTLTYDPSSGNLSVSGSGTVTLPERGGELRLNGGTYRALGGDVVLRVDGGEVTAGEGFTFAGEADGTVFVRPLAISNITVSKSGTGDVSGLPASPVPEGGEVTLTVTPGEGFRTGAVTVTDGEGGSVEVSRSGDRYTFTMPGSDVTVRVAFVRVFSVTVVTAPSEGGSVTVSPDGELEEGETVTVQVTPSAGFQVGSVTAETEGGAAVVCSPAGDGSYTFTMPAGDVSVTVRFLRLHAVTVRKSEGGEVTVSKTSDALAGDEIVFTVTPSGGFRLAEVSVQAGEADIPFTDSGEGRYTFAMPDSDVAVAVRFARERSVALRSTPGGSVFLSRSSGIAGETVTVTVSPDAGYLLISLSVTSGGRDIRTAYEEGRYIFTMPDGDVEVSVAFTRAVSDEPEPPSGGAGSPTVAPPAVSQGVTDLPADYVAGALSSLELALDAQALEALRSSAAQAARSVTEEQLRAALRELGLSGEEPAHIHVLTAIETSVEAYTCADGSPRTLALDITPRCHVVVSTAEDQADIRFEEGSGRNAVELSACEAAVSGGAELAVPVPEGFVREGDRVLVRHEHGDEVYFYESTCAGGVVRFRDPHGFSRFTLIVLDGSMLSGLAAAPGTMDPFDPAATEHTVLVDSAVDSVTLTVTRVSPDAAVAAAAVSPDGVRAVVREDGSVAVSGLRAGENVITLTVTDSRGRSTVYTVTVVRASFPVEVVEPAIGAVQVSARRAGDGEVVSVTVAAPEGYHADGLSVITASGVAVEAADLGDGTYAFTMPRSSVTVEARLVPCLSRAYEDLDVGAWYHEYTDYVLRRAYMLGVGERLFDPEGVVTRAQMVMVLWNREGCPDVGGGTAFGDVPGDAWYAGAVAWASGAGIVYGDENGLFGPENAITREEMAVMLARYDAYTRQTPHTGADIPFVDADAVSDWARTAVSWCVQAGLLNGVGGNLLAPSAPTLRAALAAVLMRYDALVGASRTGTSRSVA